MIGYTRAHRERFDHPLFASQKFCRGYAWDWMVAQAAFKEHDIEIKGQMVTLYRGQFSHSMRYMTTAFGWSLGVTQRFIDRLKTEHMIDTATNHGQIIITICKYDIYQADQSSAKEVNDTPNDTAAIQDRYSSDTNKKEGYTNGKNVKEKKVEFVLFWNLWPNKSSKQTAVKAWDKISVEDQRIIISLPSAGFEAWQRSAPNANPILPASFLNQRRWEDAPLLKENYNGNRTNTPQGAERVDPALEQIARLTGI